MKKICHKIAKDVLRHYASWILLAKKPEIIAVTGSIAKSSTKEAIFSILSNKYSDKVAKSEGNLNTDIGLPLAILRFKKTRSIYLLPLVLILALFRTIILLIGKYPKILVLEMAADKPYDIEYLCSFIKPKIAVVTAIGPAHLHTFKTIDYIVKEKTKLVESLPQYGFAVLNQNDRFVAEMAKKTKAEVRFFVPKNHDIATSAAITIGKIYGLKYSEIEEGLKKITPLTGRMNLINGKNDCLILFDAYNANPLSVSFALHRLVDLAEKYHKKRKIAVLGDMLELGDYAEKGHKQIGQESKKTTDLLLTTGKLGKIIADEGNGNYFRTKEELISYLEKKIQKNDIVLVKASHKMKFEEIVNAIRRRK